MKKFIIGASAAVLLLFAAYYMVFGLGIYIDLHPGTDAAAVFRTEGTDILRQDGSGGWEVLEIKGVDLSSSEPGGAVLDFTPDEEDYLRWLEQIGALGANTVRVYTVLDEDFYNAFYEYNTTHEEPLYLLQGLQVSDAANYGSRDMYDVDFLDLLLKNGRAAVDVIHGRKLITLGDVSGTGRYRRDISEWVLGYLVGHEWDSGNMAYTNESTLYPSSYSGRYFTTSEDATRFEAAMARIMDEITEYESSKYKTQRIIGFVNGPTTDPFEYSDFYAARLQKYVQADAEHVLPTEELSSGYFAAYRLSAAARGLTEHISDAQRVKLAPILASLDTGDIYEGYIHLITEYHTMPVIAAFGFSTSRAPVLEGEPPLDEEGQGEALVRVCGDCEEAGWAGVLVSTYQDVWDRRTWNTSYSTYEFREPVWQDVQSDGQCYGLMEFYLGDSRVCLVDGDASEWTAEDVVVRTEDGSLSMKYDEKYVYFYAEGESYSPGVEAIYIPLDITPYSGSTYCSSFGLPFERAADFVIYIGGASGSRIVVQERYDTLWAMYAYDLAHEDQYDEPRAADSPIFRHISLMVQRAEPIPVGSWLPAVTHETGHLTYGNANPDSPDYNSLADFCFTESGVEIRIPYQLLNFSSSAEMTVHGDYYENYGVQSVYISEIYAGLSFGAADSRIRMGAFALEGWGDILTYSERLKDSYYILQAYWAGG